MADPQQSPTPVPSDRAARDVEPLDIREGSASVTGEYPAQRAPRQERGRRRVDEILDAAVALVVEVGPAAASIGEIAKRAGASVGSIYHFFPSKEAIFDAIRARYDAEARLKAEEILAGADRWASLPLPEFVSSLLAPFREFLERIPTYFLASVDSAGHRNVKSAETSAAMNRAIAAVLMRRDPTLSPGEASLRVSVMSSIGEGLTALMGRADPATHQRLIAELERAIGGYLATFESGASAQ